MPRVVGEGVHLAEAIPIDEIGRHQVLRRNRLRVADRERRLLDRPVDRPPDVDHGVATLQEPGSARGLEQLRHPPAAGQGGVVVVHVAHGLADAGGGTLLGRRRAQRVVEDHDLGGAGRRLQDLLDLRVVHRMNLGRVVEVPDRRLTSEQDEALFVQRWLRRQRSSVAHPNAMRLRSAAAPRDAGRRLERVVDRLLRHRGQVVHLRLDGRALRRVHQAAAGV